MLGVNQDVIISKLLERGIIQRSAIRGKYSIVDEPSQPLRNRNYILNRFATHPVDPDDGCILMDRWLLSEIGVIAALASASVRPQLQAQQVVDTWSIDDVQVVFGERPIKSIIRYGYHSQGRDYNEYIARVAPDADGVVRTYGLEYELYSLTTPQESNLAYLLETLPAHVTERDGSLGPGGVEIVFMPMDATQYVRTVKILAKFVRENQVQMENGFHEGDGAGMHTTYGVSNGTASKLDMQIRLNRYALALQALATKQQIKNIFGRAFGHYRELPTSTTTDAHGNAFSCNGRPRTCWECRLPNWKADPEKLVEFFKITETIFHRPFNSEDFSKLFDLLGGAVQDGV